MTSQVVPSPAEFRMAQARSSLRRLLGEVGEEVLEVLAQKSSDAVFVVDAERNVLLYNRKAEELTGFSRGEVLGRHCLTGFRCTHCLEACRIFDRGAIEGVEVELFRKDGSRIKVKKSATAVRDAAGQVVGAVETFREVEGGGAAANTLDDDEKALVFSGLDMFMSSIGRGVLVVDADFRVRRASAAFAGLLGRRVEALLGQPVESVLGKELLGADSLFRRALLGGERREGWRGSIVLSNGTSMPVSVTGAQFDAVALCGAGAHSEGRYLLVVRPETPAGPDGQASRPTGGLVSFEGMVARSPAMQKVFHLVEHLRDIDSTVLVTGESGTGKELVARAIHTRSSRANRPFVAVNCGALPADLLETELFGHARGAFTGAVRDKAGRCEVAEDGTLFLDEIGDLPLALQVKLLRVLQERTFERVGETKTRAFRARVVAATHQDLVRLVDQKHFREDLFYRLNVVPLALPPLRERREDLEPLIKHLLDKIGQRQSRALRLSPAAMRPLLSHAWPGNVRQLENALEYATAVCDGQTIQIEDLPPEVGGGLSQSVAERRGVAEVAMDSPPSRQAGLSYPSREDLLSALAQSRYRRAETAQRLGISRTTLWRRMKELGLG